ncbi:S41 family peptidase [Dyadobacter aurulentus]|uniref:S41 family peptidase n=1 Tax=Dyadobacter sp. UC 10 TaxID=2605428 RepID=UPI0011F14D86|nr:S41 family peptidase [Dyadobacter sp. UC 10]KAA0989855.1 hypothetical protein FXO21_06615 [Dyadobacter sp. UC 10]
MYFKLIIYFLSAMLLSEAVAQKNSAYITRDAALKDLHIIRKSTEEVHAGLNRFNQQNTFTATYDSVKSVIETYDSLSPIQFFRVINPLFTKIKCGHVKFLPPMQDFPFYYHTEQVLPIVVRFDDSDRLLIVASDRRELTGKFITHINGTGIPEILQTLRRNMFVDGDITASADAQIQQYFSAWYADFIQDKSDFLLTLTNASNHSEAIRVNGISSKEWIALDKSFTKTAPQNELRFEKDSIAILRIAHFYASSSKAFDAFLKKSFSEINQRKTSRLIIDLRGNEGGTDMLGKELYTYIAKGEFQYYDHIEVKIRSKKDVTYRDLAYFPKFSGLAGLFIKKKDGKLVWNKHQNLGTHQPARKAYQGEVYFLSDGLSYSVTSEFLAVAKSQSRGVFVGSESGGAYSGNNSGAFLIFKLPASRFDIGLPVATYYSAVQPPKQPARGIIPDFPVKPSAADLLAGRDAVLEFAFSQPRPVSVPDSARR